MDSEQRKSGPWSSRTTAWALGIITSVATALAVAWGSKWLGPAQNTPKPESFVELTMSESDRKWFDLKFREIDDFARRENANPDSPAVWRAKNISVRGWIIDRTLAHGNSSTNYTFEVPTRYLFGAKTRSIEVTFYARFESPPHKDCVRVAIFERMNGQLESSVQSIYCRILGEWKLQSGLLPTR